MRTMVNLLPMSMRRRQMARKRIIQWMVVASCVVLVGCALHWLKQREQTALAQQLEVLQREHQPTQTMLQQLVKMRQRLETLREEEAIARELESQRNPLTVLGVVSKTAGSTSGRLRLTKLELTDIQDASDVAASSSASTTSGLALTGEALDNSAVAELLDGLQDSGLFGRVELLMMTEREDGQVALRDYQVKCEF